MKPESQKIAIAEACGFTRYNPIGLRTGDNREWNPPKDNDGMRILFFAACGDLPDFVNDLHAIHEAEKCLDDSEGLRQCVCYAELLRHVGAKTDGGKSSFGVLHSTSQQRAEAFLKVIGKWEDVE